VLVIFLLAAVSYRTWRGSRSAAGGSGQGLTWRAALVPRNARQNRPDAGPAGPGAGGAQQLRPHRTTSS